MIEDFLKAKDAAWEKGIRHPKISKGVSYIQTVAKDRTSSIDYLIGKEIDDERDF